MAWGAAGVATLTKGPVGLLLPLLVAVGGTLVGGGGGALAGGRHLKYEMNTPFMNLGVTLLEKVGVHVDRVSDSTGRLADF